MGSQLGMSYPYGVSPNQPPVILSNESRRATIDPSISDKESLTPSSVPTTQVPPHSSQEEREVELEENESKRRFWSPDEDVVLAKSWATISTDAIIGNDQKDQAFWKRIGDYYNKHRPTGSMTRSYQCLKSHYYRHGNEGAHSGLTTVDVLRSLPTGHSQCHLASVAPGLDRYRPDQRTLLAIRSTPWPQRIRNNPIKIR
ncbi:uncharacterized protein LOC121997287 [Zingiber officinale]|uniref:uncharacterized protein LOC121997287 n=1 Tax=Zingiber officinale TaxID=94328 RepID=UPI001C4B2A5B|nr:uncharacterized protein LOC121997287 [Zingiber officinale]